MGKMFVVLAQCSVAGKMPRGKTCDGSGAAIEWVHVLPAFPLRLIIGLAPSTFQRGLNYGKRTENMSRVYGNAGKSLRLCRSTISRRIPGAMTST